MYSNKLYSDLIKICMKIFFLMFFLVQSIVATEKLNFNSKLIMSEQVSIDIPNSFTVLDSKSVFERYPIKNRRPTLVFGNKLGNTNIALNHTKNKAKQSDLPQLKEVFKQQFNQPGIDFISSTIRTIHAVDHIILEFISPAPDGKIYNKMVMTTLNGRLLIWTFNCPAEEYNKWKKTVDRIIESVKIFPRENIKK